MGSVVMRAMALVALAGQLQMLPAALTCVSEHRRPDLAAHCQQSGHGDMAMNDHGQAAVRGVPDAAQSLCGVLGPCAAPTPAVVQVPPGIAPVVVAVTAIGRMPAAPPSVHLTPQPPPPQA